MLPAALAGPRWGGEPGSAENRSLARRLVSHPERAKLMDLAFLYIAEEAANCIDRLCAIRQVVAPTRMLQRLTNFALKLGSAAWIKAQTVSMLFQQPLHFFEITSIQPWSTAESGDRQ